MPSGPRMHPPRRPSPVEGDESRGRHEVRSGSGLQHGQSGEVEPLSPVRSRDSEAALERMLSRISGTEDEMNMGRKGRPPPLQGVTRSKFWQEDDPVRPVSRNKFFNDEQPIGSVSRNKFHQDEDEPRKRSHLGNGSFQQEVAFERVMERLEDINAQLSSVAGSQHLVEAFVKRIYPELMSDSNPRGLSSFPSSAGHLGAPVQPVQPVTYKKPRGDRDFGKASRSNSSLDPDELGFWPREELATTPNGFLKLSTSGSVKPPPGVRMIRRAGSMEDTRSVFKLQAIHPDSWGRAFFDFVSIVALLYDSIVIPHQMAWPLPFTGWIAWASWGSFIFWFVDLVMGFCTGYHDKNGLVLDLSRIAKHYIMGSFLPNLLVVVADCLGMLQATFDESGHLRETTLIKLMRLIKLQRLVRLASSFRHGKVAEARDWLATVLRQRGLHEQFDFMTRICNLVFYIIWVNHLGGCLWHLVGTDARHRWFNMYLAGNVDGLRRLEGPRSLTDYAGPPAEPSLAYQYMLGVYCSATAMIAGGSVMVPTNVVELMALVLYIVLGFILSSVLISTLLATVMEYQDANKERNEKLKILRQFLYQHALDPRLAVPIVKQVHQAMWRRKQLAEGDVEALSLLSPMMRSELWYHIYGQHLAANPFLSACNAIKRGLIKDICFRALQRSSYKPGSLVFEPGHEATGAHFVCHGSLDYHSAYLSSIQSEDDMMFAARRSGNGLGKSVAETGTWISEPAFWVHWLHRGWLDARTPCEIMTVLAERFIQIVSSRPELQVVVQAYSRQMLKTLEEEGLEITDLVSLPHQSIVAAMPMSARVRLSQAGLTVLQTKAQWSNRLLKPTGLQELNDEVNRGICDLVIMNDEVERVVTIVVLHLRRRDGYLLAQIGKCAKGSRTPSCELPGTKVQDGESPKCAMERCVREKLGVMCRSIQLGPCAVNLQEKVSQKYGLKSKYKRLIFETDLTVETSDVTRVVTKGEGRSATPNALSRFFGRLTSSFGRCPTLGANYDAFVIPKEISSSSDTVFVYAWLRPEDFRVLESPAGERHLHRWMTDLDLSGVLDNGKRSMSSLGGEA